MGAEENTGDGAGILMSMPDEFMRATVPAELPEAGHYAAGIAFLDRDIETSGQQEQAIAKIVREEGLEVLAWRVVPTNPDGLGLQALAAMPGFKTLVVASPDGALAGVDLDRKTFRIRKRVEHEVGVYFASLSARTITYKGMLTTMQLTHFFEDLNDERMKATIAIVHSRFSTNTFPSWPLAQPFRLLAHNGEINTIQGNRNWLSAREGRLSSELLGEFEPLLPITTPGYSDSLKGSGNLKYNEKKAKELWAKANAISPWTSDDKFTFAYNADGGHEVIYTAVVNSINNVLGAGVAATNPYPTFNDFRTAVSDRKVNGAFRSGWQPDYPSAENYLVQNFASAAADGNGSNDGDYKNPEFDALCDKAAASKSVADANKLYQQAQEVLLNDLPAVPLYYANAYGVASTGVSGFEMNWQNLPVYENMTKSGK